MSAVIPKSPARTMHWCHICVFIDKSLGRIDSPQYKRDLLEFCREEHDKAEREGYDDTAQYMQHIIDDLTT